MMEPPESDEAIIDLPMDRETGLRVGRIVLFGPTGSGKTLAACAFAKMMAPNAMFERHEVFVLSPVPTAANNLPGSQWFRIPPTDKRKVEAFMSTIKDHRCLLLLDEADSYFGGSGRTYGTDSTFEAVNFGRNYCLSMIVVAHGTNVAPKNLIGNAQAVLIYRTTEVNLLDYAEDYLQDQIGEEVGDVRYVVSNLPDYTALVFAPMSKDKFVGFAKLDMQSGEIRIWRPSNPESPGPTAEDQSTITGSDTEPGEKPGGAVPSAESSSPTAGGPATAPNAT